MASHEEWCTDKLSKLLQEELRISTLTEMKEYMSTISQPEASRIACALDLPIVFDCLNNSNKEQIDLACEVLSLCMNNLNLGESTSKYDVSLGRALKHPYESVKLMALTEIERNIGKEETVYDLCKRTYLLFSIIECIGNKEISVAKKAVNIVTAVGLNDIGLKTLISSNVNNKLTETMSIDEIVRLRVYEMIINIAKESPGNLKQLQSTGILSEILEEINEDDILLKMNIIELFTQLGVSNHGYLYLEENHIFSKIFSIIEENDESVLVQLCEPGILRFFGNIARSKPKELIGKYPKLFNRLFTNIECGDLTVVGVSLDTLAVIATSNDGKFALNSTGNSISFAIKSIVKMLTAFPTDVRIRALNCLASLLRVDDKTTSVCQLTRKWYQLFADNPMEVIVMYAKNPFLEIKLAGLGIVDAMAEMQWGQEEIKNNPGFVEFLLDRNVEVMKECKEMKYQIIKSLATSSIFDQGILTRLQDFVKQGPFYVQGVTEIAFESNE